MLFFLYVLREVFCDKKPEKQFFHYHYSMGPVKRQTAFYVSLTIWPESFTPF